jgi:signal transduction histidine kinase
MRKVVIVSLAFGLLLVLGALRVYDLVTARAEIDRRARTRASSDALVLAEYLRGTFDAGDAALRQLALHSQRIGGPSAPSSEWTPSLASAGAGLRAIGAISVLDREFVIRHSNRPALIGQSRAGESSFQSVRLDDPPDGLIVGAPFKSPLYERYLIPIARALTRADGTLEGFIVASFLPADVRAFFSSISVGERGAVWVFHADGITLVQEPSPEDQMGTRAADNAVFRAASGGAADGILEGPVIAGGAEMISAFRRVSDLPLIVAVSLDRQEMLMPWHREMSGLVVTYAAVTVLVGAVLVVLFRQMDAKTAAEAELERTRIADAERLRQANEQLTDLLAREQAARAEAEVANALKDQFVMTISHELRTPLTAIAGWAKMLVDGMVGEDKREDALRTIERNAQAQKRLIEDLLDMAGIMAGKLQLDLQPVAVGDMVRAAVDAIAPGAQKKGVRIEADIARDAGTIEADPERLQQVVWNLLLNAVKFTPAGGRVVISAYRAEGALHIRVTDTGSGIAAELLPHVFERFRQGDAARRLGGLGLGLAIVRNLVELHGGTVSAHSEGAGRGATFDVVLPAA